MKLTQSQLIEILNRPGPHWLVSADLSGLDLSGADLQDSNLSNSKMIETKLLGANLAGANIKWTSFSQAILVGAHFNFANITFGVDFSEADLREVNFQDAFFIAVDMRKANLTNAYLDYASTMREFYSSSTSNYYAEYAVSFDGAIMMDGNEYIPYGERYCECPVCNNEIPPGAFSCSMCHTEIPIEQNLPVLDRRKK